MLESRRTRRFVSAICLAWIAIAPTLYVVTRFRHLSLMHESASSYRMLSVGQGSMQLLHGSYAPYAASDPAGWTTIVITQADVPDMFSPRIRWWFLYRSPGPTTLVSIPLWVLALPALAILFMTWRRSRCAERNPCPSCGYSLAGLESNTCPECGSAVGTNKN